MREIMTNHGAGNDKGAVLVTGLIILVVLSLIGLVAMQSTTLQERMAGNLEQRDAAFQAAEAGLRGAEEWLNSVVILPAFDSTCNNGLCKPKTDGTVWWKTLDWNNPAKYRTYQEGNISARYIIEHVANTNITGSDSVKFAPVPEEGAGVYRIISRGISPNGLVEVILQTTFVR